MDHDAEVTACHLAIFDQAFHDRAGEVGRDGQAHALAPAGMAQNSGVDADEPAVNANQRPAGIAGVDGGVGL